MELPVSVREALGDNAGGVALRDIRQAGSDQLLRMVLLSDDQGNVQVICRHDDLLDINSLNRQLGRDLRVMKRREQLRVRERAGRAAGVAIADRVAHHRGQSRGQP